MFQSRISRCLAVAALAAGLAACAHDTSMQSSTAASTAAYTDDASINTNVQTAIMGVPGVDADNLQVSTQDGVVKLRGRVDDQMAAQNAVQAARQVQGVKTVDYDIDIGNQ